MRKEDVRFDLYALISAHFEGYFYTDIEYAAHLEETMGCLSAS